MLVLKLGRRLLFLTLLALRDWQLMIMAFVGRVWKVVHEDSNDLEMVAPEVSRKTESESETSTIKGIAFL